MGKSTFTADGRAPFVFDDNWDNFGNMRPDSRRLSETNGDNLPVVQLTEEQKFTFDSQGWLCIPGVLEEAELEPMREFCHRLKDDAKSLPPHQRTPIAGPLESLVDHPVVVGFCNEFLSYPRLDGADHYGFRFETSFLYYRELGMGTFSPHNGNGVWAAARQLARVSRHSRQGLLGTDALRVGAQPGARGGRRHAVRERQPQGGLYLARPRSTSRIRRCGAATRVPPARWSSSARPPPTAPVPATNPEVPRVAIFNQYNGIGSRFHWWEPPRELLESMPGKRRSLFRHAYGEAANTGLETRNLFARALG